MKRRESALALGLLGLAIGAWSTLCGIGGGVFAVPLLHYAYGFELRAAVANSLWLVAASTSAATIAEIARSDSVLDGRILAVLVFASVAGTRAGFWISQRIPTRALKLLFCVLLVAVAWRVFAAPATPSAKGAAAAIVDLTPGAYASIAAVGLFAGIVAPLLGIGGGLVAVPGLFLGLPAIGYATARACSTAMSAFNGWQSVWLYRKEKLSRPATALWLAAGALVGGVAGDALIHVEGVVPFAQRLLGATLLLAAARFAWDLRRTARAPGPPAPRA
jgi:uncharacterized membrane protein YfcA